MAISPSDRLVEVNSSKSVSNQRRGAHGAFCVGAVRIRMEGINVVPLQPPICLRIMLQRTGYAVRSNLNKASIEMLYKCDTLQSQKQEPESQLQPLPTWGCIFRRPQALVFSTVHAMGWVSCELSRARSSF